MDSAGQDWQTHRRACRLSQVLAFTACDADRIHAGLRGRKQERSRLECEMASAAADRAAARRCVDVVWV